MAQRQQIPDQQALPRQRDIAEWQRARHVGSAAPATPTEPVNGRLGRRHVRRPEAPVAERAWQHARLLRGRADWGLTRQPDDARSTAYTDAHTRGPCGHINDGL